jgi:tRNA G18 (ribose-2'-O)-methylase SpoU
MRVTPLADPGDARLADFTALTDVAARSRREPAEGLFIAEGAKVIARAVAAGYRPRAVLTEAKWLPGLEPVLGQVDVDVLVAPAEVLRTVTGYRVHRGALAAMQRRALPSPAAVLAGARLVVVLVDLVDHTNVGAVFRNAAALGADAVLVTPGCADPLYRRAVKVSMGAVLGLPWTRTGPDPLADLAAAGGMTTIGLTPAAHAVDLAEVSVSGPRALLLGTEGDGLPEALQRRCDVRARIPMAGGIDSLNVAAASAIALHALRPPTRTG